MALPLDPQPSEITMPQDFLLNRGNPWDHDPGPPKGRRWAEIFSSTPNYRGLGRALGGGEEFRWHFGPMFYRGNLSDNHARVLIVGQEGAQDESLGRRSFLGGTGARMQHFLKHLGITESYLFVNTFVYPIFEQYEGAALVWLGQNPKSPIVKHRHELFNYILEQQDIRLIVAVGKAAKETVHTWVTSRGGVCPAGTHDVSECAASALDPKTRIVGVVHPGAGGQGTSTTVIIADFKRALRRIAEWDSADPTWLPVDPGATRGTPDSYKYKSAAIPFRDLPYGIAWRVGQGGTSSNRKDGQKAIQIFSEDGKYAASVPYPSGAAGSKEGYFDETGDLPYEPPRHSPEDYDRGPSLALAKLMMGGEAGLEWPDFAALGVTQHVSFGRGPIYRGRPEQARVLVLADQESEDDLFTTRAMTGDAGQRFQKFLEAMGIDKSYLILRVLPVDTLDLTAAQVRTIVDHPQVQKVYKAIVEKVAVEADAKLALVVGPYSKRLAAHVLPASLRKIELSAWRQSGALAQWQGALGVINTISYEKDITSPSFSYDGKRGRIPSNDLPYGTPRWMGSSGDRGLRARIEGRWSPHYYKIVMPTWAAQLQPASLSQDEQDAIGEAP